MPADWTALVDALVEAAEGYGAQAPGRTYAKKKAARQALLAALQQQQQDSERLTSAIRWALGEEGEFPYRAAGQIGPNNGPYWWRPELRHRAFSAPIHPLSRKDDPER